MSHRSTRLPRHEVAPWTAAARTFNVQCQGGCNPGEYAGKTLDSGQYGGRHQRERANGCLQTPLLAWSTCSEESPPGRLTANPNRNLLDSLHVHASRTRTRERVSRPDTCAG